MNYETKELNNVKYIVLKDKIWINLQGFMAHLGEMSNENYLKTIAHFLKIPIEILKVNDEFVGQTYFNKIVVIK